MKRSGAVTAAAVVLIVVSAGACLFTFPTAIGMALIRTSEPQHSTPMPVLIRTIAIALIGVWGIVTGIGLLRLRRWAWFCVLAIAVLLMAAAVPGVLQAPQLIWATGGPSGDAPGLLVFEYVNFAFNSLAPLALGIWWLALFVPRGTRAQFARPSAQ